MLLSVGQYLIDLKKSTGSPLELNSFTSAVLFCQLYLCYELSTHNILAYIVTFYGLISLLFLFSSHSQCFPLRRSRFSYVFCVFSFVSVLLLVALFHTFITPYRL